MTKKILFSIAMVAGLASCNGDYDDWMSPQRNDANEAAEKFIMTSQPATTSINFADANPESVILFTTNLQAGQTEQFDVTLSAEGNDNVQRLVATPEGKVALADLENAVLAIFGKKPVERTLTVAADAKVLVATADGTVSVDKSIEPFELKATPNAPFIASAYYLVGDMLAWNADGMKKFSRSSLDVYEDPVFTVMFTVTAPNQYWKIIPQTNIDSGNFWAEGTEGVVGVAVDGDASTSGLLVTNAPKAGKIEVPGDYKMTINMMDYTYTITPVAPIYYVVGAVQGWSNTAKTCIFMPNANSPKVQTFTTKWTGAWDLKIWNAEDFGNWNNCYGSMVDGDNSMSGDLIGVGAQAISAPSAEFYTLTIDMSSMKYTWTKLDNQEPATYTKIGVIGDFNGWGGDFELEEKAPHNWYGVTTVTSGGLKFRANGGWDMNWGTKLTVSDADFYGVGTQNGDNISVPEGTYAFHFNDITGEFAIVKQ